MGSSWLENAKCLVCSSHDLVTVMDLGKMPLANRLQTEPYASYEEGHPDYLPTYPLAIAQCQHCRHIQLQMTIDPAVLYADYPFRTGISDTFRQSCEYLVDTLTSVGPTDLWVDIGCNDGTLLKAARSIRRCDVLGIDPSEQTVHAMTDGIPIVQGFFGMGMLDKLGDHHPKVITAQNVLAHQRDLHDFVSAVASWMGEDSIFVFEVPWALNMFNDRAFDQIYHEHVSYFLAGPLQKLLEQHGLYAYAVEEITTHGGSLRVFAWKHNDIEGAWDSFIDDERAQGVYSLQEWAAFDRDVRQFREDFPRLLAGLPGTTAGLGASAKATTLLNYCNIDERLVEFIVDDTREKQGHWIPGANVPICSRECMGRKKKRPDNMVIFAHNYADELMRKYPGFNYVLPRVKRNAEVAPAYREV